MLSRLPQELQNFCEPLHPPDLEINRWQATSDDGRFLASKVDDLLQAYLFNKIGYIMADDGIVSETIQYAEGVLSRHQVTNFV